MRITQNNGVISVYLDDVSRGWQKIVYLFSDVHIDSTYARREAYFSHLERAKKEKSLILDGGDLFDAMQGRFDPRRNLDELRPEYRREDYYDFVVSDVSRLLSPYAESFVAFGTGNHELSVRKFANIDLTERLVYELRRLGSPALRMGSKSWIRFMLLSSGKPRGSILLRYSHSGGGSFSPVTKGVLETNRQAVYLPDANIVWNGHNHHGWIFPISRERLSNKGTVYQDLVWFVRTPGYKSEYVLGDLGYAAQRALGPTPIGCIRLVLEYSAFPTVKAELVLE
ncbi:MAG: hypothetical protein QXS68_05835 [Candidatus Methanomethylicaceae archaeon]